MNFKKHSELEGLHAFLGPSKYHWINYDEEKVAQSFIKFLAIQKGTELHEFAKRCIELKIKLPKSKKSLNQYVNDAISYRMIPEQILFYSDNSFGTADTISFRDNFLRIHDLKTGETPASINQLKIYAALFFLEYDEDLTTTEIELRIYQSDEIIIYKPDYDEIRSIMDKIILFDKKINSIKLEDVL